ncbi:MAG: tetratricopeptide repeat protein, partial [FCB group bacterium]|nr:tetratricopeptide repeat protein [FCB group bacterium]
MTTLVLAAAAGTGAEEESAANFNTVGAQHYSAGEWPEAIDAFSKAIELAPENPTIRRNLCNA